MEETIKCYYCDKYTDNENHVCNDCMKQSKDEEEYAVDVYAETGIRI